MTCIDLTNTGVTDDIMYLIAALLELNRSIKRIVLNNNHITVEGLETLIDCLTSNGHLAYIELHGNPIDYYSLRKEINNYHRMRMHHNKEEVS